MYKPAYTAAVAAGALVVAGVGTGVAFAASSAKTHTLKFTSITLKQKNLSKTEFGGAAKDVDSKGKIVGFDTLYGKFSSASGSGYVTVVTKGGVLYSTLKFTNGPTTTGKVTGGTGKFKGATGTLTATNLNKSGSKTAVTLTYHG